MSPPAANARSSVGAPINADRKTANDICLIVKPLMTSLPMICGVDATPIWPVKHPAGENIPARDTLGAHNKNVIQMNASHRRASD